MRAGRLIYWVTLSTLVSEDGHGDALDPPGCWASINPGPPGLSDSDRSISHAVGMRFHPQVSLDTRIRYADRQGTNHDLRVRGMQNVQLQDVELRLLCEEVIA